MPNFRLVITGLLFVVFALLLLRLISTTGAILGIIIGTTLALIGAFIPSRRYD